MTLVPRALRAPASLAGAVLVALCACGPASARDAVVRSFDGTPLLTHFYAAATLEAGERAPTVLIGPAWASPGYTIPDSGGRSDGGGRLGVRNLLDAGFNVLTWDPRGFGASGGIAQFDSPEFEGRDVQSLVDYVATLPEALLDAPRDPRVGMSGSSYGGGVQWVAGAIDHRLDALVPDISWHSLVTSFARDGAFKAGWMLAICAQGHLFGLLDGVTGTLGPTGPRVGTVAAQLTSLCAEGTLLGRLLPASTRWLADRGPGALVARVRAPTLILQGTVDTLFAPGEAVANYAALHAGGVPVKMLWYCGGHGACTTPAGDPALVEQTGLRWLRRWLLGDATVDTGPPFQWIDDGGVLRSAPGYPLAPAGALHAAGSGSLLVLPSASVTYGSTTIATPALGAVEARYAAPAAEADVVGEPRLTLTYRGTALPASTFVYAQVVDAAAGRVVGNQVTPIPVVLDGTQRTVARELEIVALRARPASDLRVRITASNPLYAGQRSTGVVAAMSVASSLPLVDPARAGAAGAQQHPRPRPPAAAPGPLARALGALRSLLRP